MSARDHSSPVVAILVFAVAIVTYGSTLAPGVGLIDSPPLTVAAWSLGNAHPPGFPLFLMVTHIATRVPAGSVAWRANACSAFFAALACAMLALAIAEALRARSQPKGIIAAAMLLGGTLLAFSRTLWSYATITEVYALNTFLITTILWLMLSWRRSGNIKRIYIAAALFGLALGVHVVTVALLIPALLVLVGADFLRSRRFAICVAFALVAAIAVYAWLPLAASRHPVLNWGDPDTTRKVFRHATARMYQSNVTTAELAEQTRRAIRYAGRELGPPFLPLALLLSIAGLIAAFREDRTLFRVLLLMIAAASAWFLVYPILNDEDAYLLPAFVAMAFATGYGGAVLSRERTAISIALLAVPLIAALAHQRDRDRSEFFVAEDYARNALRSMEHDSILITDDSNLWGALLYLREVESVRRDVKPILYALLIRSWYIEQLERHQPEMMAAVKGELAACKRLLDIAENDATRWRSEPLLQRELQGRLDDVILALIAAQLAGGGHAYATYDVAMSRREIDRELVQRLAEKYDLVPGGIPLAILPGHRIRRIAAVPLELRGLADTTDDVVATQIRPVYVTVLRLRARYLSFTGGRNGAIDSLRDALRLEPGNVDAQRELAQLESAR